MFRLNTRCYAPDDGPIGGAGEETEAPVNDTDPVEDINDNSDIIDDDSLEPSNPIQDEAPIKEEKPDSVQALVQFLREQAEGKSAAKAPEAPKTLTPDEIEASLGRVKLTAEDLASLGFLEADEKQVAGFQKFADNLMTYAAKKAEALMEARFAAAEKDYAPIRQEYLSKQQEAHRASFYEKNPQFKGKEDLVAIVAKSMAADPKVSALPPDKLLTHLATTVNQLLTKAGINPQTAKPAPQKVVPKPNTLSSTGGSTEAKKSGSGSRDPQANLAARILG